MARVAPRERMEVNERLMSFSVAGCGEGVSHRPEALKGADEIQESED